MREYRRCDAHAPASASAQTSRQSHQVCGLWANIWKGSGVAMRVRAPFASLNKATAVVEMILELGRRVEVSGRPTRSPPRLAQPNNRLTQLAAALRIEKSASALCRKYPEARFAACVAAQLLLDQPCEAAAGPIAHHVGSWLRSAASTGPNELLEKLLQLGQGGGNATRASERFAIYWLFGICGVGGPKARTGHGWDELLASLACMLGVQTLVLVASSNDNGLLHQELVDYELPGGLGWGAQKSTYPDDFLHNVGRCVAVFTRTAFHERSSPPCASALHTLVCAEKFPAAPATAPFTYSKGAWRDCLQVPRTLWVGSGR